jgi:hypothetical protein
LRNANEVSRPNVRVHRQDRGVNLPPKRDVTPLRQIAAIFQQNDACGLSALESAPSAIPKGNIGPSFVPISGAGQAAYLQIEVEARTR